MLVAQQWLVLILGYDDPLRLCLDSHNISWAYHGLLTWYVKLWVAHAPGTFYPPPRVSDPDLHHGTRMTHVPWCMSGSLTSCFHWILCRVKRSQYSRRMRNPQFCVSGKRPIVRTLCFVAVWFRHIHRATRFTGFEKCRIWRVKTRYMEKRGARVLGKNTTLLDSWK